MKKVICVVVVLLVAVMVSGCGSTRELVLDKLNADEIDRIQVVLAMGNPYYGADSRIITDKAEIRAIVEAFNQATVGKRVPDSDLWVADASKYLLYADGQLVGQFFCNGNDSERVWYGGAFQYVSYPDKTPYELYGESRAEVIVVDEDLNEMERPEE